MVLRTNNSWSWIISNGYDNTGGFDNTVVFLIILIILLVFDNTDNTVVF